MVYCLSFLRSAALPPRNPMLTCSGMLRFVSACAPCISKEIRRNPPIFIDLQFTADLKLTSEYLDSFQTRCAWITLYLRIVRVVPTQLISWQYYCDEILYIYKIFVLCSFQCSCRPVRVGLYIIAPLQLSVKNFFIFFWNRFKSRLSHSWRKNAETNWNCRRLTV